MWILNYYVSKSFFLTFLMAMGVLTFGMTGNNLIKVFEYVSSGVPITSALIFLGYMLPMALAFTIPWAALVSIMLVFGRMSADNEITAMRACGVSILQIISPIIVACFVMTCLCLYLQLQVGPEYLGKARSMLRNVVVDQPLAIFTPGIPSEFDKLRILIGSKDSSGKIKEIQIFVMDSEGKVAQDVTASNGEIRTDPETQSMNIILYNAMVVALDGDKETPIRTFSESLVFPIEYGKRINMLPVEIQGKYLNWRNLFARAIMDIRRGLDTTNLEVELNQRVALALAPMAFLLLGMPLAIRTSRRETSIGLFLSVLLAGIYYGGVLTSDALRDHAAFLPQYIVWIPPFIFQAFGIYYLIKIARK